MDLGTTIRGKRLGILGLGRIGRAVARRAEVFGLYRLLRHQADGRSSLSAYPGLMELAEASDASWSRARVVKRTAAWSTRCLEGARIKGFLINTARGHRRSVCTGGARGRDDCRCCARRIRRRTECTCGLMKMENVVLTPHVRSQTVAPWGTSCTTIFARIGKPVLTPVRQT